MLAVTHIKHSIKYNKYNITWDDDYLAIRLLGFCSHAVAEYVPEEMLYETKPIKGKMVYKPNGCYMITHELIIDKQHPLWKPCTKLSIYTTYDLAINGRLAVTPTHKLDYIEDKFVFANVICSEANQSFCDCDKQVFLYKDSSVYSDKSLDKAICADSLEMTFTYTTPKYVKSNQLFQIDVEGQTSLGSKLNGSVLFDSYSGYLPKRVINFVDGKSTVYVLSLGVNDFVAVGPNGNDCIIEVKNDL